MTPGYGFPSGASPIHALGESMIPMSLSEGDLLWLEPETEEEREWLVSAPQEWSLDRLWCEWNKVDRKVAA